MKTRIFVSVSTLSLAAIGLSASLVGCGSASPSGGDVAEEHVGQVEQLITYSPQAVAHPNSSKRIFMHYMPWFEANGTQHGYTRHGTYGSHWTMANCTATTNGLLNQVCADDAPMIGPYSSSDPYVVEYHLLLLKYSGVDGVVIDWGGVMNVADLPDNKYNGEALMSQLSNFGLKFQVMMEDRNYVRNNGPNDFSNPVNISDDTNDLTNDLKCLKANGTCGNLYWGSPNYEKLAGNNTPVVGVFGPTTYRQSNGDAYVWDNGWANAGLSPSSTTAYSLWWQDSDLSNENRGSTAWVWAGQGAVGNSSWTVEDHMNYYSANEPAPGSNHVKMGAIVPAYYAYYQQGGWSSDSASFSIPYNNGTNVDQLFNIVNGSNANYMQLVTFNDFGEGTEFEPSVNKGFSALNHLQQDLGVAYGTNELTLVYNLFQQRISARLSNNTTRQAQLDQASAYLAALNTSAAACIINGTGCGGGGGGGGGSSVGDTMNGGSTINAGSYMMSQDRQNQAIIQTDGNFVLYQGGVAAWRTSTNGTGANHVSMQSDSNLVVYDANNNAKWTSGTNGRSGTRLVMQNDGNLVMYTSSGGAVWASNTNQNVGSQVGVYTLHKNARITSPDYRFEAVMQTDGNFVIYYGSTALWASGTNGTGADHVSFQSDGNLVVYDPSNNAKWTSGSNGSGATTLKMQSDGNLVIYNASGGAVWSTNTCCH